MWAFHSLSDKWSWPTTSSYLLRIHQRSFSAAYHRSRANRTGGCMTAAADEDPLENAPTSELPAAGSQFLSGMATRPTPTGLRRDLRRAAEEYSQQAGGSVRGGMRLYAKAAVLSATAAILYLSLLLYVSSWTFAIPMLVLLGICLAGIAFNISHDASHGSFCSWRFGNRLLAQTIDLIGASSYYWYRKHNREAPRLHEHRRRR